MSLRHGKRLPWRKDTPKGRGWPSARRHPMHAKDTNLRIMDDEGQGIVFRGRRSQRQLHERTVTATGPPSDTLPEGHISRRQPTAGVLGSPRRSSWKVSPDGVHPQETTQGPPLGAPGLGKQTPRFSGYEVGHPLRLTSSSTKDQNGEPDRS